MRTWACLFALAAALPAEDPVEAFLSADASKRREATFALAAWPGAVAAVPLLVDLTDDDDEKIREVAAAALTRLGRKALPEYFRFLGDPDDPARAPFLASGDLLARLDAAVTAGDLHLLLTSGDAAERRAGAATAVLAVALEEGIDVTLDVLAGSLGDPDPSVRAMAATSLALLGWDEGSENATDEEMQPALQAMKWDQVAIRRAGACVVLLLRPEGIEFRKALPHEGVLWRAANERLFVIGLGGAARPRTKDLLQTLDVLERDPRPKPTDRDWTLTYARCAGALRAIREHGISDEEALAQRLSKLLAGDFGALRADLARTLLKIAPHRSDEVVKAAIEILAAPDEAPVAGLPEERRARRAIDVRGRQEAIALLAGMDPREKAAIPAFVAVLGWKEDPETEADGDLAARSAALGSLFWHVRRAKRAAADALGAFGKDAAEAKPALEALLSHKDLRLRYRAARAIRRIG